MIIFYIKFSAIFVLSINTEHIPKSAHIAIELMDLSNFKCPDS